MFLGDKSHSIIGIASSTIGAVRKSDGLVIRVSCFTDLNHKDILSFLKSVKDKYKVDIGGI